jgi:RNA polymerase sigma factor (sigma-70 family)
VEASAFRAPSGLARGRISVGGPLLRLRSDEQLVALFRAGNDEAFRVIHDRYRQRLFAYTRQMLPGSRQDAEDALQDVFVRAYSGLRANDRTLALRAWLYRIAHNRCIDELRRPALPAPEVLELVRPPAGDPIAEAEQRESLRRLVADVRRLPEQQRSALLMRELGGMTYNDIGDALDVSIPAIKSLLVRARVSLAQSAEARDTPCGEIREELVLAHDRGVRPGGLARRHMHECHACSQFRVQLRGTSRQLAALVPGLGPAAIVAKLLGFGGGGFGFGGGSGAAASGGVAAVGTGGGLASVGVLATGAGHVATLLAAAVVTAGGAVEIQQSIAQPSQHHARHTRPGSASATSAGPSTAMKSAGSAAAVTAQSSRGAGSQTGASSSAPVAPKSSPAMRSHAVASHAPPTSITPLTLTTPAPVAATKPPDPVVASSTSTPSTGTTSAPTTSGPAEGSSTTSGGTTSPNTGTAAASSSPSSSSSTQAGSSGSQGSTTGATTSIATTSGTSGTSGSGGPSGTT